MEFSFQTAMSRSENNGSHTARHGIHSGQRISLNFVHTAIFWPGGPLVTFAMSLSKYNVLFRDPSARLIIHHDLLKIQVSFAIFADCLHMLCSCMPRPGQLRNVFIDNG